MFPFDVKGNAKLPWSEIKKLIFPTKILKKNNLQISRQKGFLEGNALKCFKTEVVNCQTKCELFFSWTLIEI